MKTFNLICPHCRKAYRLGGRGVQEWYDYHVVNCAARVEHSRANGGYGGWYDAIGYAGSVLLLLFGQRGEVKDARVGLNLIMTTGREAAIDRLQAATPAVHDYQAIGTGTNAAAAGDTALQTEVARVQGALSQPTSTTDRLVTTFGAGVGTGAITETGRLNAAAAGNLFARQVFAVINKAAGDSLATTHDITD